MKKFIVGLSLGLGLFVGLNFASHAASREEPRYMNKATCMSNCLSLEGNDENACNHSCDGYPN